MTTPVSGPGQFSQRTDKAVSAANNALPNAQYGENADYQDLKASAPMAGSGAIAQGFNSLFGNPAANVIGLNADTQLPDVPVTDGAAAGPGQGPEALSSGQNQSSGYMASYLVALEFLANEPGSSDAARNLVRQLKSQL
ncbi:MAG TPA: hypothetical protein VIY48_18390 [Candidatus Paceibacterota bacterium]